MKVLVYSNSCKNRKYYKQHIAISLVKEGVIDIYILYINNWNHKKLSRKFILTFCTAGHYHKSFSFSNNLDTNDLAGIMEYTYSEYHRIEVLPQFFKYVVEI